MGTSPTPTKKIEKKKILPPSVDFLKAVGLLLDWKCVSRIAWDDKNVFIFFSRDDGLIKLHSNGKITDVILHRNDFESTDWIVVNEDEEDSQ